MSDASWPWTAFVAALLVCACGEDPPSESTSDGGTTLAGSSGGDATSDSTAVTDPDTTTQSDASSSGGSLDSSTSSATGSSGADDSGTTGAGLSFENDVWPLLVLERDPPLSGTTTSCNGCHGGGGAGGLAMPDPATAYANLLDAPSSSALCAGIPRVVAGDPDGSCFVVFYEMRLRDQLAWVEMPETDLVRAWVDSGAAP